MTAVPLPLTEANLRLFDPAMATPLTPQSKTTVPSNAGSTSKKSSNVRETRELFEINNLLIGDVDAAERCSSLIEEAKEVLKGHRNSAMKTVSLKKAAATYGRLKQRNETTFMIEMWKHFIKEAREVAEEICVDTSSSQDDQNNRREWISRTWAQDNLDYNYDQEFKENSIPTVEVGNDPQRIESRTAALSSCPKLKNPKPDMAFGLTKSAFTTFQRDTNIQYSNLAQVSPGILHTFFVVEGKGTGGSLQQARNQACRAGAAVVSVTRQLIAISCHNVIDTGVDPRTMAFSLAMTPSTAHISVHWAETTKEGETFYHMQFLEGYILEKSEDIRALRHDIDNILDWGVLNRKTKICEILDKIKERTIKPVPTGTASSKKREGG